MAFSVSYPEQPYPPFWGSPDANTNFCEEDYVITPFVAEFINTLTNVTYVIYAARGLRKLDARQHVEWLQVMPFVGLIAVGLCSAAFHMTLREIPQLCDDISMALPTAFVVCRLLAIDKRPGSATRIRMTVAIILTIVYTIHVLTNEVILHSLTFVVMLIFIGFTTRRMLSKRVSEPQIRKRLAEQARLGAGLFVLGFVLWIIDRRACVHLTKAKRAIGLPWAFVLELHGWWHITTAVGAYHFITLVERLAMDHTEKAGENVGPSPIERSIKGVAKRKIVGKGEAGDGGS